jgi:hypothetical protein
MFEAQVQQHGQAPMGQVIPFPGQPAPQAQAQGSLLPSFPILALSLDRAAGRVPWYAWAVIGAYFMYRLLRSVR